MKESYREGIANHPGPEPCEGSRKAALEALDRGICRLGIELRKSRFRETDGVRLSGRPQRVARQRKCGAALRSRRPHACRETLCARTGRPRCRPRAVGGPEGRPQAKENTQETNPCRTPSRSSGPSGLARVREAAKQDGKLKFTAPLHHVSIELLRESYHSLKKEAAPGVD